jgi:hypothetical protein
LGKVRLTKVHPAILFSMKATPACYIANRYAEKMNVIPGEGNTRKEVARSSSQIARARSLEAKKLEKKSRSESPAPN